MAKKSLSRRVNENIRDRGVVLASRKDWGKDKVDHFGVYADRRRLKPHMIVRQPGFVSDTLWCHITVTDGYEEELRRARDIRECMQVLHRIGWDRFKSGVSYNYAVHALSGEVGVGQPLEAKGTHTVNIKGIPNFSYDQNKVAFAVAFIGLPGVKPTLRGINSYAHVMSALIEEGGLTRGHDFMPHSAVAPKECPTQNIRNIMDEIHKQGLRWAKK